MRHRGKIMQGGYKDVDFWGYEKYGGEKKRKNWFRGIIGETTIAKRVGPNRGMETFNVGPAVL